MPGLALAQRVLLLLVSFPTFEGGGGHFAIGYHTVMAHTSHFRDVYNVKILSQMYLCKKYAKLMVIRKTSTVSITNLNTANRHCSCYL